MYCLEWVFHLNMNVVSSKWLSTHTHPPFTATSNWLEPSIISYTLNLLSSMILDGCPCLRLKLKLRWMYRTGSAFPVKSNRSAYYSCYPNFTVHWALVKYSAYNSFFQDNFCFTYYLLKFWQSYGRCTEDPCKASAAVSCKEDSWVN